MIAEVFRTNLEGEAELEEEDEAIVDEETEYGGDDKTNEMSSILERLKTHEKKEKAADLVNKLKGKKKANKKIMPYEIYATSGE
jgi:ribosomal protein L4